LLGDRRRLVSMRGLTRPDAGRCHPGEALRHHPQRNSRSGVESLVSSLIRRMVRHISPFLTVAIGRRSSSIHIRHDADPAAGQRTHQKVAADPARRRLMSNIGPGKRRCVSRRANGGLDLPESRRPLDCGVLCIPSRKCARAGAVYGKTRKGYTSSRHRA
jgi:hypothetical protein